MYYYQRQCNGETRTMQRMEGMRVIRTQKSISSSDNIHHVEDSELKQIYRIK